MRVMFHEKAMLVPVARAPHDELQICAAAPVETLIQLAVE
jgi:hypothetical protein